MNRPFHFTLSILPFLLTGCVIGGEPPTPPEPPAAAPIVLPAPEPAVEVRAPLPQEFVFTWTPQPPLPPPHETAKPLAVAAPAKVPPRATAQSPEHVIKDANQAARLAPTARNYFGGGATARYIYTPGRIYDVYLSPASGTKIVLPVSEVLAHEVILPPDAFDVSSVTIGTEVSRNTVLFIRPCAASEPGCKPVSSVDVALVSESGRSFDLHLIVGKVGMVGVTWAVNPIQQIQLEEAPPIPGPGR